ncbi:MAG: hypothetical protein NTV01_00595 [Bacteroidia bacterium]|nr:hypothetical protein [Bacteroidia bacterium]
MTNKETIERKIGLTFDFVNYLIDKPELAEDLPDNFKLEFVEKDFPKIEKMQVEEQRSPLKKKFVRVRNTFELTK